jgi:hypothetical protein
MKKSPLATVKERFSDKAGLIKAVRDLATEALWLDRLNDDKGLERVSNAKLLHLHDVLSQVKKDFGSRDKLIGEIAKLQKRVKDADYQAGLKKLSTPKLLETFRAATKRSKAAA